MGNANECSVWMLRIIQSTDTKNSDLVFSVVNNVGLVCCQLCLLPQIKQKKNLQYFLHHFDGFHVVFIVYLHQIVQRQNDSSEWFVLALYLIEFHVDILHCLIIYIQDPLEQWPTMWLKSSFSPFEH